MKGQNKLHQTFTLYFHLLHSIVNGGKSKIVTHLRDVIIGNFELMALIIGNIKLWHLYLVLQPLKKPFHCINSALLK